jgi:hypothetical protein
MVLWRSQADEIEALRAEVRNLRGEMAAQQAALEEMDTLVERMVYSDSMAQMQLVLRRATTIAGSSAKGGTRATGVRASEPAESTALIGPPNGCARKFAPKDESPVISDRASSTSVSVHP